MKKKYLDMTVVFLMYMDKLVCNDSNSNQVSIGGGGGAELLGCDWRVNMGSI